MQICTLMSGSSGNATYVEASGTKLLIDAGQSGKKIVTALHRACGVNPCELDAILITHAHRDHVCGAGILARKYDLPIYATEGTWFEMKSLIGSVKEERQNVFRTGENFQLGAICIETFPVSHDAMEPVGYICSNKKRRFGIATDSGVFTAQMRKVLNNLDCLILEANHDTEMLHTGPYPWSLKRRVSGAGGHLSNEKAGEALLKVMGKNTKNVVLAHLSEENNNPQLALQTVERVLKEGQIDVEGIEITVAPRYGPGRWIKLS